VKFKMAKKNKKGLALILLLLGGIGVVMFSKKAKAQPTPNLFFVNFNVNGVPAETAKVGDNVFMEFGFDKSITNADYTIAKVDVDGKEIANDKSKLIEGKSPASILGVKDVGKLMEITIIWYDKLNVKIGEASAKLQT